MLQESNRFAHLCTAYNSILQNLYYLNVFRKISVNFSEFYTMMINFRWNLSLFVEIFTERYRNCRKSKIIAGSQWIFQNIIPLFFSKVAKSGRKKKGIASRGLGSFLSPRAQRSVRPGWRLRCGRRLQREALPRGGPRAPEAGVPASAAVPCRTPAFGCFGTDLCE